MVMFIFQVFRSKMNYNIELKTDPMVLPGHLVSVKMSFMFPSLDQKTIPGEKNPNMSRT